MEPTDRYYKEMILRSKKINFLLEIAYQGNVGLHEMAKFFQVATPEEVKQFEQLMERDDIPNAWELVQRVVGVRLQGL